MLKATLAAIAAAAAAPTAGAMASAAAAAADAAAEACWDHGGRDGHGSRHKVRSTTAEEGIKKFVLKKSRPSGGYSKSILKHGWRDSSPNL